MIISIPSNNLREQLNMIDPVQAELDALIAAENAASQRALLLVLQALNRNLMANTAATQTIQASFTSHVDTFTKHAATEEAYLNRGRGAWWVLSTVLVAVQALAVYAWTEVSTTMSIMQTRITQLEVSKKP
jgi:hypothetical protein